MDLLQLRLHGQPADVGLQVCAVHHADAEHDERDVLRLGAHQAAAPPARSLWLVGRGGFTLLVLKNHFTERLGGTVTTFCRQTRQEGNQSYPKTPASKSWLHISYRQAKTLPVSKSALKQFFFPWLRAQFEI